MQLFSVQARALPPGLVDDDEIYFAPREHAPIVGLDASTWAVVPDVEVWRIAFNLCLSRGMTPAGAQCAVGLGWAESRLGVRRWDHKSRAAVVPCTSSCPQFLLSDGRPSFNWGAVTAREGMPYFGGADKDWSGKKITQRWAYFDSMDKGLEYWATGFLAIREALPHFNSGDALLGAAAMFDRGYYTGTNCTREECIRAYAQMVLHAADEIAKGLAMPLLVRATGTVPVAGALKSGGGGGGYTPPAGGAPKPTDDEDSGGGGIALAAGAAAVVIGVLAARFV